MKVLLRRDLFLGGSRYRRNNLGTEIPDVVDNKKVVLYSKDKVGAADELVLPKDAIAFDPEKVPVLQLMGKVLKNEPKPKPMALSQMPKQASDLELLEKKK